MFDPAGVPEDVVPRKIVETTNELMEALRRRLVDKIQLAEPESGYRTSNKVRAYCQVHVRRCLELAETAASLLALGHNLAALMVVRAIYESVAIFLKFQSDLEKFTVELDSDAALEKVDVFVNGNTFATKLKHLIKESGHPEVEAKNILNAVDHVTKRLETFREEYERLSEFTHPNSFGAFQWFAKLSSEGNVVEFDTVDPEPKETLRYVVDGAILLGLVFEGLDKVDELLPRLSAAGAKLWPAHD